VTTRTRALSVIAHDARMLQLGQKERFARETFVAIELARCDDFDRNWLVCLEIGRTINRTHSPCAGELTDHEALA
jgi:hypothetical protein